MNQRGGNGRTCISGRIADSLGTMSYSIHSAHVADRLHIPVAYPLSSLLRLLPSGR